jgi:hypothetical protein
VKRYCREGEEVEMEGESKCEKDRTILINVVYNMF